MERGRILFFENFDASTDYAGKSGQPSNNNSRYDFFCIHEVP